MESNEAPRIPQETSARTSRHVRMIFAVGVVLGLVGGVSWWMGLGSYLAQRQEYANRTETFSGNSESLKQTVVVPTLDAPCPPGKNVIWCSSFQLAWNEIKDKVIGAPLEVVGAEEVAARLNAAKQSGSDLEPRSFYAAGGWIKDGIVDKIKRDMAAKFPEHALPDFSNLQGEVLAYSYSMASVPFRSPFLQATKPFGFSDSQAGQTDVEAFGVWEGRSPRNARRQVAILYHWHGGRPDRRDDEYAIDLCKYSQPYQVVAAMVEPKGSLAQTLEHIRLQAKKFREVARSEAQGLRETDALVVPEMVCRIDHRFNELIRKDAANAGGPIIEAMQTIRFRLDRCGAAVESEGRFATVKRSPQEFIFDRPFLVYMQKRGAEHPFFVMWVDNAELLTRK